MNFFTKLPYEIDEKEFNKDVIFHCYWNGSLSKKHLYSIKSCYYFNVNKNKSNRKIILWLQQLPQKPMYNHKQRGLYLMKANQYKIENEILQEIEKYAEIRIFDLETEIKDLFDIDTEQEIKKKLVNLSYLPLYADLVRLILLYKYAGVWFDLDCFFLRDFSPLFSMFEDDIVSYRWEEENYPNNAILIAVKKKSMKILKLIQFLSKTETFSFQNNLFFHNNIDMVVLPCEYFDPLWTLKGQNKKDFFTHTDKHVNLQTFYQFSFCYHWHNLWSFPVDDTSPFSQLCKEIDHLLINSL